MIATNNRAEELPKERVFRLYKWMSMSRQFDEQAQKLFDTGQLPSSIHCGIGQEAVGAGVCDVLREDDYVLPSHRGQGPYFARGADPRFVAAEFLGRGTGYSKAKSGGMHLMYFGGKTPVIAQGILGQASLYAVGFGIAIRYRKTDQVVVCIMGDGTTSEGAVHEAMNMAGAWKLPIIFGVENNLYAISVPNKAAIAVENIADRGPGYGMPGVVVDGMDVLAVAEAVKTAVDRARRGEGPSLLEFKTYRFMGHSRGDPKWGMYRAREEVESWMAKDPLKRLAVQGGLTDTEVADIEREAKAIITEAIEHAKGDPAPAPEEALEDVYA